MEPQAKAVRQSKTILVVEDDDSIRDILLMLLDTLGYRHFAASDGLAAVKILENEAVDVIITDFQMPRMDGVELLNWCRGHHLHMPVIFTTATSHVLPKEKIALGDCCASLLAKPFELDTLAAALDAAVKREHHPNCLHG